MKRLLACLLWALLLSVAHAAPPEGADPRLAPWFGSLERPDVGGSCCSLYSDCRFVESSDLRIGAKGYEARLKPGDFKVDAPTWVVIPNEKILQRYDNPDGRAVVCWMPNLGVLCFVRGTET